MTNLMQTLIERGVRIHAPESCSISEVLPERIEPGVEIYPGTTLCGSETELGAGTKLGLVGGGYFENIHTGRGVQLWSGYFKESVFLDHVLVRSNAEVREGCLLEENSELGHTVGLKQTILMPQCILGSLINFCDALLAGGLSRQCHTEVGSCMALYNYTPWGNKFASLFGDVAHGVFLSEEPIFIGGQTQIVSPVIVDYGTVIAAGSKLQTNLEANTLILSHPQETKRAFNRQMLPKVLQKVKNTFIYIKNLNHLRLWYEIPRKTYAYRDPFLTSLYEASLSAIHICHAERIKRLEKLMEKIHISLTLHEQSNNTSLIHDHKLALDYYNAEKNTLTQLPSISPSDWTPLLKHLQTAADQNVPYIQAIRSLPASMRVF